MGKGVFFILLTGSFLHRLIFTAVREQQRLKAIAESRERFLVDVLSCTETATWEYDQSASRITDSLNLDVVLGCSPEQVAEQPLWEHAIPQSAAADEGKPAVSVLPFRGSRGEQRWLESRVSRSSDQPSRFLGTSTDVTERVLLEHKVSELTRDLERRVQERTADLERANEELESFTRAAAHDLRAPLRAIGGYVRIARGDLGEALSDDTRDYFDRIERNVHRMASIIDHLLELSRLGRTEVHREALDVSSIAERVLSDLRRADEDRIVLSTVQSNLSAFGDAVLVRTLLENLIGNAWKYTSQKAEACIDVGAKRTPAGTVFYVRDDGIGFEPEQAERIFRPFERLRGQSEFPGDGIGLASVSKIVALHGGSIWAEASPDAGATFFFTLGVESRSPAA